ncbi:hypothetical protein GN956_G26868, partial [Arapaima gigas]
MDGCKSSCVTDVGVTKRFDDLELLDSLDPDFRNDRNKKGAVGQDLDLSDVLDDPTSKTSFSGVNTPTEAPVKREPKPIS